MKMHQYTRKRRRSHGYQRQKDNLIERVELGFEKPFQQIENTFEDKMSRLEKYEVLKNYISD